MNQLCIEEYVKNNYKFLWTSPIEWDLFILFYFRKHIHSHWTTVLPLQFKRTKIENRQIKRKAKQNKNGKLSFCLVKLENTGEMENYLCAFLSRRK